MIIEILASGRCLKEQLHMKLISWFDSKPPGFLTIILTSLVVDKAENDDKDQ